MTSIVLETSGGGDEAEEEAEEGVLRPLYPTVHPLIVEEVRKCLSPYNVELTHVIRELR